MPLSGRERRIRAEAKRRGIERIRTVDEPGGKYARVYVVKTAGPRGGHTLEGVPQKKKGKKNGR